MPAFSGNNNKACRIFGELAAAVTASFVYQRDNEYNPFVQSHRMMRHDDCASLGDSKYQEVPMSHFAIAGQIFFLESRHGTLSSCNCRWHCRRDMANTQ